ncbi:uncharacterized protein [Branchiostoma lanceolatum]|uniref:uncharacterized protein n=1 Tax=Branchiostoma lanceolatum TaxID=7740 RepID=UPI003451CD09
MGSVASKSASRRKHKGAPLPPPLPPKPLDPRIKLDPKEKFYLQKSWKTVARNEDVAAMTMFISLFRSSPEIKEKWPQLRKLSEDEILPGRPRLPDPGPGEARTDARRHDQPRHLTGGPMEAGGTVPNRCGGSLGGQVHTEVQGHIPEVHHFRSGKHRHRLRSTLRMSGTACREALSAIVIALCWVSCEMLCARLTRDRLLAETI